MTFIQDANATAGIVEADEDQPDLVLAAVVTAVIAAVDTAHLVDTHTLKRIVCLIDDGGFLHSLVSRGLAPVVIDINGYKNHYYHNNGYIKLLPNRAQNAPVFAELVTYINEKV